MEEDYYDNIIFQEEGQGNAIGLIDFSTENDELILDASMQQSKPSENLKEFSEFDLMGSTSIDAGKEADIIGSNNPVDIFPDPIKSPEPERAMRKGKCNLRKSLAWDSAFFTNAGVLDPEELSSIIGGAEKNEKHNLPQIVEDVSESTDSFSTLESDNLTLENLEVGFFEDIRASIQKSNVATDVLSTKAAPKKVEPAAIKNQASRSKAVAEKPYTIPKAPPKQNILPRVAMKATKHEPQDTKSAAKNGVSTTSTKASRIISSGNHISTAIGKRASLSATASTQGAAISTKRAEPSKLPAKSCLISTSSIKKNELLSRLSSDSSKSLPPVHATISPVKAADRRKLGNRIVTKSTSDSTRKTTTRTAPAKDRAAIEESDLSSTCLVSSKNTSSMSPSSVQSSASSISASCRSSGYDNIPLNLDQNSDQMFDEHGKDLSSLTGTLSHQAASMKPSGLRKPSPSIGFFNGMKTVSTPKGSLQHGGVPLLSAKAGGAAVSCRSREIGFKPNTKKHHSTTLPEMTIQCSDDKASDVRLSRQGDDEVARDAEIIQCDLKENGVSEKVMVEIDSKMVGGGDAATVFSMESLNNCRDPLADIKVVCSGSSQENFDELST